MARRQTRFRGRVAQRRESLWMFLPVGADIMSSGSTAILAGSLNADALALRPFTVIRTRGIFSLRSDQVATSEDFGASFGVAVVSDQAVAIGITAVPTPETDRGSDLWLVHETIHSRFIQGTTVGFEKDGMIHRVRIFRIQSF